MENYQDLKVALDTVWVIIAASFIFFMSAGFALLETGLCQTKNLVSILLKNLAVYAIAAFAYWMLGFGLQFSSGNPVIGQTGMFLMGADNSPSVKNYTGVFPSLSFAGISLMSKFMFQLGFASTSTVIISGAVAERIKLINFLLFSLLFVALIYPTSGHWIWGGGWLQTIGFYDFAGSAAVHLVGGTAALVGIYLLGPRTGFQEGQTFPPSSRRSAAIGGMLLWLCWWFFNGGSTMAATASIGAIVGNTNFAASGGALSGLLAGWYLDGQANLNKMINGLLGGLVAITASCAYVSPLSAITIGIVAGILTIYSEKWMIELGLDDPIGAVPVHFACGILGTICLGIFSQGSINGVSPAPLHGLIFGGGSYQFGIQLLGVLSVGAFVGLVSLIFWLVLKILMGLRLSDLEQKEGADNLQHGVKDD